MLSACMRSRFAVCMHVWWCCWYSGGDGAWCAVSACMRSAVGALFLCMRGLSHVRRTVSAGAHAAYALLSTAPK